MTDPAPPHPLTETLSSTSETLPITATSTYAGFEATRTNLLHLLTSISQIDRELELKEASDSMNDLTRKVQEGVFRVLVLGEFKRGKSTLINALLGSPILPANVTPTTALLTAVRYAEQPSAVVHYYADNVQREVPIDGLRQILSLSSDEADNRRRQSEIRLVEVMYPAQLCRNNVELIDSPGLNEHATRTELTSGYIRQCDAAIFVLSATNFGSLTEGRFLSEHLIDKGLRHIFFAINQFDRILSDADDPEREARSLQALAYNRLSPLCQIDGTDMSTNRIHFVSARPALRAKQSGDDTGLRDSGIPGLESALEGFLSGERGRVLLSRPLILAEGAIAAAAEAVAFRRQTLSLDLQVLEDRARQVEPEFEALRQRKQRILTTIASTRDRLSSTVELSLRRRTGELSDGLLTAVEAFTIDATWNPTTVRLSLINQLNDYLQGEMGKWTETIGAEVQAGLEHLIAEIGTDAVDIDQSLRRIRLHVLEGDDAVLSADTDATTDPSDVIEAILAIGGGRFLSDFDILMGGSPGWLGAAARVIAFQLAAGAVVAALGIAAGPLVAISTAVGAAILAIVSRRGAIERALRERTVEAARPEIARLPDRALPAILAQVSSTFAGLSDAISTGIDVMIDNVQATIAAALEERRAREHEIEPELQRLSDYDNRLITIRQQLSTLCTSIV